LGLAGSLASAGLGPLVVWLVERGYVDLIASTSANVTEDLLELRGARFFQVDPEHVDDAELWRRGYYRFYDHVVGANDYDAMEDFTRGFFETLAKRWPAPSISGARFMHEFGGWLDAQGLGGGGGAPCVPPPPPPCVPRAPPRAAVRPGGPRRPAGRGLSRGGRQGAGGGLLRRLRDRAAHHGALHAAGARHVGHLPRRRSAEGLHPD